MNDEEQNGLIDDEDEKSNDDNSEFQAKILEDNKIIRKDSNSISNYNEEVRNDNEEEHEHKKIPIEKLNYFSNIINIILSSNQNFILFTLIVIISSGSHIKI